MPGADEEAYPKPHLAQVAPKPAGRTIYTYLGFLLLVLPFTSIWGTHVSFILKDEFHMSPVAITHYGFLVSLPATIFAWVFGFIRDRWSPFGKRDQGWIVVCSLLIALLFFCLSGLRITYPAIFVVALTNAALHQLINGAQQGLTAAFGQEHAMSGRLAAWWKGIAGIPGLVMTYLSGVITERFAPRGTFLLTAAIALGVAVFALWRPKDVFDDPVEASPAPRTALLDDFLRLITCTAMFPPLLLLLLWNFTPGVGTSMQFFLTNTLHASPSQFTLFGVIFSGFFIPTFFLHGYLCTRFALRPILLVSTIIGVPQILPLLTVHSVQSALVAAVPMGLMGGFASAAYFDLLMRSCPPGLQGTVMLLGSGIFALSDQLGNMAGAYLYSWHGFTACAWATAIVYAFMLPVLLLVPKHLTTTKDGEPLPA